jgi:hypothetical protein
LEEIIRGTGRAIKSRRTRQSRGDAKKGGFTGQVLLKRGWVGGGERRR